MVRIKFVLASNENSSKRHNYQKQKVISSLIRTQVVLSWNRVSIYLWIQKWHKSPVHGEDLGDVAEGRNLFDVAEVEVRVRAGQLAEVFHQRVVVRQVIVNSEIGEN